MLYEKEFIYAGEFTEQHPLTGEVVKTFKVTLKMLKNWLAQFNSMRQAGIDVPCPVQHTDNPLDRAATVKALRLGKDTKGRDALFFVHEYVSDDMALRLAHSSVSLFSPEAYHYNGVSYESPIVHIAFTDYPVIPDLDARVKLSSNTVPQALACSLTKDIGMYEQLRKDLQIPAETADDAVPGFVAQLIASLKAGCDELRASVAALTDKLVAADSSAQAKADEVIALTLSLRQTSIDALFSAGSLTASNAQALKDAWTKPETCTADGNNAFNALCLSLSTSKQVPLGSRTGLQETDGGTKVNRLKAAIERQSKVKNS